jgi:hypothetical protein
MQKSLGNEWMANKDVLNGTTLMTFEIEVIKDIDNFTRFEQTVE